MHRTHCYGNEKKASDRQRKHKKGMKKLINRRKGPNNNNRIWYSNHFCAVVVVVVVYFFARMRCNGFLFGFASASVYIASSMTRYWQLWFFIEYFSCYLFSAINFISALVFLCLHRSHTRVHILSFLTVAPVPFRKCTSTQRRVAHIHIQ